MINLGEKVWITERQAFETVQAKEDTLRLCFVKGQKVLP